MNEKNPLFWSSLQTVVLVFLVALLFASISGCSPAHQGCIVVERQTLDESPVVLIHEDQHTLILKNPKQSNTPCCSKPSPSSDQPLSGQ